MPPESQLKVHLQVSTPNSAQRSDHMWIDTLAFVKHSLALSGQTDGAVAEADTVCRLASQL